MQKEADDSPIFTPGTKLADITTTSSFLETARKARYLGEPTTRNRLTALLTPAAKALARSREKKEAFLRFLTPVRIFSQSLGSNAKTRGANRNAGAY